jgi:type IV pilus assembly protein PilO
MAKGFNDLPSNVQTTILVVAAVVVSAVGFYYLDLPLSQERDKINAQVAVLKAQNDKDEAFKAQQTEYLNRIQQLQQQLTTLASIVPDQPATDEFINMIHQSGLSTSVNVRSFVSKPQVQKDLYVEMPFSLHLDGTYYELVKFFDSLAHAQRIVTVSDLTLGGPEGGGIGSYKVSPTETVGANCTVTTYYNRPAAPPSEKPAKKK